jgi:hypothetical protein
MAGIIRDKQGGSCREAYRGRIEKGKEMRIEKMTMNCGLEDYTLYDGDYYIGFERVEKYEEYIMLFEENTCCAIIEGKTRKIFEEKWEEIQK